MEEERIPRGLECECKPLELGKFLPAFVKAQGEIKGARKDATNPHFQSAYATLESVLDAIKEPLNTNDIAIIQFPMATGNQHVGLTTRLYHVSGEYIESFISMPMDKPSAQAAGSALTYARRYALMAMTGLAPEDDDGNGAAKKAEKKPAKRTPKPKAPAKPEPEQGEFPVEPAKRKELGDMENVEVVREIGSLLLAACGDNREMAAQELEQLTGFEGKNRDTQKPEWVSGVTSLEDMKDWSRKRLEVNYRKARKLFEDRMGH